jgi:hypothetical protein
MAVPLTPVEARIKKGRHKKAPVAIRPIAFMVKPVRPRVACISPVVFFSGIYDFLRFAFLQIVPMKIRTMPSGTMINHDANFRLALWYTHTFVYLARL